MKRGEITLEVTPWGVKAWGRERKGLKPQAELAWRESAEEEMSSSSGGLTRKEEAIAQDLGAAAEMVSGGPGGTPHSLRPITLLLPWNNSLFRTLTLPRLRPKDCLQAFRWALEEEVALPIEELACSWRPLAVPAADDKVTYGVAVTRRADLDRWRLIAERAKLKVIRADFALCRRGLSWSTRRDVLYAEKTDEGKILLAVYRYGTLLAVAEEWPEAACISQFIQRIRECPFRDEEESEGFQAAPANELPALEWVAGGKDPSKTHRLLAEFWPGKELPEQYLSCKTEEGIRVWQTAWNLPFREAQGKFIPFGGPQPRIPWQQGALALWGVALLLFGFCEVLPAYEEARNLRAEAALIEKQLAQAKRVADSFSAWTMKVHAGAEDLQALEPIIGGYQAELRQVTYEPGGRLEVRGVSLNSAAIKQFLDAVEKRGWSTPRFQTYRYSGEGIEWQVILSQGGRPSVGGEEI